MEKAENEAKKKWWGWRRKEKKKRQQSSCKLWTLGLILEKLRDLKKKTQNTNIDTICSEKRGKNDD